MKNMRTYAEDVDGSMVTQVLSASAQLPPLRLDNGPAHQPPVHAIIQTGYIAWSLYRAAGRQPPLQESLPKVVFDSCLLGLLILLGLLGDIIIARVGGRDLVRRETSARPQGKDEISAPGRYFNAMLDTIGVAASAYARWFPHKTGPQPSRLSGAPGQRVRRRPRGGLTMKSRLRAATAPG